MPPHRLNFYFLKETADLYTEPHNLQLSGLSPFLQNAVKATAD